MKLAAFAGSTRQGSFNVKLLHAAIEIAKDEGADVEWLDFNEYEMPLFGEDLEKQGTPKAALAFKAKLKGADGFLIASPEYNSSFPALLKNAIDWASRPAEGEAMLTAFAGKACGLFAASPGGLGGIRMLPGLRSLLMNIMVEVVPAQFALSKAHEAFADDGTLSDERARKAVTSVVRATIARASSLAGA